MSPTSFVDSTATGRRATRLLASALTLLVAWAAAGNLSLLAAAGPAVILTHPTSRTVFQGSDTTFTVSADGTAPIDYRWFKNGGLILGATSASLPLTAVTSADDGFYSVMASNSLGTAMSNPAELVVDPGVITGTNTTALLSYGSSWRFNQSGADLGTAWKDPGYNDTGAPWASGLGLLAVETTVYPEPFRTVLALGSPQVTTYYFRTHFNFNGAAADTLLVSSNLVDDGAVYYLNGTEVGRLRVPAGQTSSTTAENQPTEGAVELLEIPSSNLVVGDNVMAVEVHQTSTTSSDVVFGMALAAQVVTRGPDTVAPTIASVTAPTNNRVLVNFSERVDPATATNTSSYGINNGILVTAAYFTNDNKSVALVVSPIAESITYTLTVSSVKDRAVTPNTIVAGSQKTFTLVRSDFLSQSIGSPSPAATFTPSGTGIDITVGGTDIGGTADQFGFSYQTLTGDFDVKVRVASLDLADAWSKAGLMARETLNANSAFAATITTPSGSGTYFLIRSATGSAATSAGSFPVNHPNTWLRLRRAGSVFTGYASFDGINWSQLSAATIAMAPSVFVGMAASSHVTGQATTAEFRDYAPVVGGTIGQIRLEIEPPGPSRRTSPLAITEIMPRPAQTNLEFIEIFNSNPFPEEMSGYRLSGEVDFTFPEGFHLAGNAYVIVARDPAAFEAAYNLAAMGPFIGGLAEAGNLRLRNKENAVMLEVPYSTRNPWPVGADETGHSLVLTRASYGEEDPHAWSISAALGGSPGRHDSARAGGLHTVKINEFLAHTDLPQVDYIELYNHANQSVNITGCALSDSATTNKFVITNSTIIPARGFVVFDQNQLGFGLSSGGETVYFRAPDNRVIDAVEFEPQANGVSSGRFPDGASEIYPLASRTPGSPNGAIRNGDLVINELMYKPISGNSDDEYIELYNKGASPINIGAWRFTSGVSFSFPSNTVVAPGAYLVIARNATNLLAKYPNLNTTNTLGNFGGSLANGGERVALAMPDLNVSTNNAGQARTNTVYVVVEEVTYGTGGNWGFWANEGGSSLELTDPRSDRRLAHNWADSDETSKAPWADIEFTGVLDNGSENQAILEGFLMGEGECLLDNVQISSPTVAGGANLCTNGTFEAGLSGWVLRGDHVRSTIAPNGFGGGQALHIRADARGDSIMNRIRTPIGSPLPVGGVGTIRAKVRWLRGWPEIILRTHGNYLECYGRIPLPPNLGSPGAANSRALANAAPAIHQVTHHPIVPAVSQDVAVTARVHDPDGVTSLLLKYRIDPSPSQTSVTMRDDGLGLDTIANDGVFTGTIPGQPTNTLVAFQVVATDSLGASRLFPLQDTSYARPFECLVRFGDPVISTSFATYRQWMTAANSSDWQNRPALSNERVFETFVYGNFRVIYNTSAKWSGSPYHQFTGAPATTAAHYSIELPRDNIFLGTENLNKIHAPGNGPFDDNTTQREQFCYWMARQLGLPYNYRRFVNMFFNGNRRGGTTSIMEDTQTPGNDVINSIFPDDPDGDLYKIQPWFETDDTAVGSVGFRNVAWASLNRFQTFSNNVPVHKAARYRHNYLVRAADLTANNYTPVFQLVDAANTPTNGWEAFNAAMESVVDVEQWMRTFAIHHSVGDWDHYGSQNSQNMYGYKGRDNKWKLMIWDMNIVLNNSGSWGPGANLFVINTQDPIMPRMFASPKFRRAYLRALKEICTGPWQQSKVDAVLDSKHNALLAAGITPTAPSVAVKPFINSARTTILATVAAEEGAAFTLTSSATVNTTNNLVVITGEAPVEIAFIRINGVLHPITWTRVRNWQVRIVVDDPTTVLNIEGLNLAGTPIPGATLSVTVNYTGTDVAPEGQLVISEIHYNPAALDAAFVEIQNRAPNFAFDLTGWRLNGVGYTFPGGTVIAGGQHLTLVQNGAGFSAAFPGAPFFDQFGGRLDNGGETLGLERPQYSYTTNGIIITTNVTYLAIDKVRYDDDAPWPSVADGNGPSLQLIDSAQDNSRVSNWTDKQVWRQFKITGNIGATTNGLKLYMYLDAPSSEVLIDDISLVEGTVAETGVNLIRNGGFEAGLDPWQLSTNNTPSVVVTSDSHSGTASFRLASLIAGAASLTRSVYQDIFDVVPSTVYTLSFWYLPTSKATNLIIRTAPGSALFPTVNVRPILATPSAPNSVAGTLPPYDPVWLNEVQANNFSGITDNNGERDPWIELYNAGDAPIDLGNYYLADNYGLNLLQWQFPSGTTIAPKAFRLVWADAQTAQGSGASLHANFRLSANGGALALVRQIDGKPQITDYFNYPAMGADLTYGSAPDGQPFNRVVMFNPTPGATNIARNVNVFINEWMASNTNFLADPADGAFDDWFELYNAGDAAVDLGGYHLTDNLANGNQYQIPTNGQYVIAPGEFLLVFADNSPGQNDESRPELHTNFQLARGGEAIGLFAPDGQTPIDAISFGEQTNNVSQGRFADGSASIYFMTTPTPRGPNTINAAGNTAPTLASIPGKIVTVGQTLTFTALGSDVDVPAQSLTYSLGAGAPAGATIHPTTGQFTWTPLASQAPGTIPITVRVTDSGIPALTASQTFLVMVSLPPTVNITPGEGGQIHLTFDAIVGRTYRVDYKRNLDDAEWTPLAPAEIATSNTVMVEDTLDNNPHRFYRIVQVD